MLPGFRFLFAAVMLSMSLLIFGLGAAALLRAAHESFASNSSWHAAPEVPFAQRPDTTMPVLAALRVDMNAMEKTNDQATVVAAPVAQSPSSVPAAQNDQVAALKPIETPLSETTKPAELPAAMQPAETPPAAETASPLPVSPTGETAGPADERQVALATPDAMPVRSEPARSEPTRTEPTKTELAPQAEQVITTPETMVAPASMAADSLAATKIATLGGPPVDVTDEVSAPETTPLPRPRPDLSAIKKRVQARRAMQRRRLALRARLLLQQQQAYPFGQPPPFPPPAAAH